MNNFSDLVGGANLVNGSSYSFTSDRFNNSNQAVNFNNGYLTVPPGIYFSGDFTFTAWFTITQYWSSGVKAVFGFGNGPMSDNVYFDFLIQGPGSGANPSLQYNVFRGSSSSGTGLTLNTQMILSNKWYHLAFTLSGTKATTYLNGRLLGSSGSLNVPESIIRSQNAIGALPGVSALQNYIGNMDDVKIYKGAMLENEVLNAFNVESQNTNFKTNIALGGNCDANNICASPAYCKTGTCKSKLFFLI